MALNSKTQFMYLVMLAYSHVSQDYPDVKYDLQELVYEYDRT